jgi:hypothetical protein
VPPGGCEARELLFLLFNGLPCTVVASANRACCVALDAGPSMMPGGSPEAYSHIKSVVEKVAAQVWAGGYVTRRWASVRYFTVPPGGAVEQPQRACCP